MSTVTAILVDDEDFNLKGLHQKIENLFPEIEIIGSYQQPEDAIDAINSNQPDILFLDIQMPRINGFELLSQLKTINFQIIFVTAYSEYAIEAFKKHATDYILKPINDKHLKKAITEAIAVNKFKNLHDNKANLAQLLLNNIAHNNKLIVLTLKGVSCIIQNNIYCIEQVGETTKIQVKGGEVYFSLDALSKFEKQLNNNFFKCNELQVVNLDFVSKIDDNGFLLLINGNKVPISKTNKIAFLNLFK